MTQQIEVAHIAQRVIRAVETASLESLRQELQAAELFAGRDREEERSELLGAIAHEMSITLAEGSSVRQALCQGLEPHVHLLYHLSRSRVSASQGYVN